MEKLSKLMGTRYITHNHTRELIKVFDSKTELDLAGCKFAFESERIMRDYYKKIKFCNTENKCLNHILEHNCRAVTDETCLSSVPLPLDIVTQEEVLNLFKTIDKSQIYRLGDCKINKVKWLSLVILLTIRHPDVTFDLREYISDLFKRVRIDWLKYRGVHSKYLEVVGMAVVEREVKAGKVYLPGEGFIGEEIFIHDYNVLPAVFGNDILYKHPEFEEVWNNAIKSLLENLDDVKTMKDYIEVID